MGIGGVLLKLAQRAPGAMAKIQSVPWLNLLLNKLIINALVSKGAARPQPFSLWTPRPIGTPLAPGTSEDKVEYISWTSLVDRRFTARHLPPAPKSYVKSLPPIEKIVALYARRSFRRSQTTSALLCFFAQWFTDSVLRTNPFDRRLNTSNHEIDLCQIYGLDAQTAALLRTREGGKLRTSQDGLFLARLTDDAGELLPENRELPYLAPLKEVGGQSLEDLVLGSLGEPPSPLTEAQIQARKARTYVTGLERGNSTIVYAAISTIFVREHNRICAELATRNPAWGDDRLFETARNINIAMLLNLVINEYINQLAQAPFKLTLQRNFAEHALWYRPNRIAIEFSLLYRWHSLMPEALTIDGQALDEDAYRFNSALLEEVGVEKVIAAASREAAGRIGLRNNPQFLEKAEGYAHQFARDQWVRPFVEYQAAFGATPARSFDELTGDPQLAAELADLYGTVDRVEFLVGLFAEQHDDATTLPDLLRTMVAVDAFSQILTNPLLASKIYGKDAFADYGLGLIESTTCFEDLVRRNCAPGREQDVFASFALKPSK